MDPVPGKFWEWMSSVRSDERTFLIFLFLASIVIVILIVSTLIYRIHKNRLEVALKRELLDRGMSADEIATVVRATPTRNCALGTNSKTRVNQI